LGPQQIRSLRLQELSRLVGRLGVEGIPVDKIIFRVSKRAHEMADHTTAEKYVAEIIRRYSK